MTLALIIIRSLRQHALSTAVTGLSVALAAGLLMSVWVAQQQSRATFINSGGGFDAVLGARGSKLQLVLNAVFHLEASPGNLPWSDYLEIQKNPAVELAVPLAVGDNYRGYRLVGTTLDLFYRTQYFPGRHYTVRPGGRLFNPDYREAVAGSFVADQLHLKPGDKFHPFHGLIYDEKNQHAETYVVVGVLQASNTPADRVIWIPLEGIQKMTGHSPEAATDVSAVLVKLKGGGAGAGFMLDQLYNKQGNRLTFAWPIGQVVAELFDKIGWFDAVLELVAYLVALVATGSVLASIYNSMNERRREIAILRALGARRSTVFGAIVLEAASISALGVVAGFIVYAVILTSAATVIRHQTGVVLNPFAGSPIMIWTTVGLIGLGALAGIVPAAKAYRTEVADHLTPIS
jgi:putative ABC transport system permease protein